LSNVSCLRLRFLNVVNCMFCVILVLFVVGLGTLSDLFFLSIMCQRGYGEFELALEDAQDRDHWRWKSWRKPADQGLLGK